GSILFFSMRRRLNPEEFIFSGEMRENLDTDRYVDSGTGAPTYPGFTSDVERVSPHGDQFGLPMDR
ncbi:hypothetical protein Ciccas_014626, partial [Cichlidogyrus casuarinus]